MYAAVRQLRRARPNLQTLNLFRHKSTDIAAKFSIPRNSTPKPDILTNKANPLLNNFSCPPISISEQFSHLTLNLRGTATYSTMTEKSTDTHKTKSPLKKPFDLKKFETKLSRTISEAQTELYKLETLAAAKGIFNNGRQQAYCLKVSKIGEEFGIKLSKHADRLLKNTYSKNDFFTNEDLASISQALQTTLGASLIESPVLFKAFKEGIPGQAGSMAALAQPTTSENNFIPECYVSKTVSDAFWLGFLEGLGPNEIKNLTKRNQAFPQITLKSIKDIIKKHEKTDQVKQFGIADLYAGWSIISFLLNTREYDRIEVFTYFKKNEYDSFIKQLKDLKHQNIGNGTLNNIIKNLRDAEVGVGSDHFRNITLSLGEIMFIKGLANQNSLTKLNRLINKIEVTQENELVRLLKNKNSRLQVSVIEQDDKALGNLEDNMYNSEDQLSLSENDRRIKLDTFPQVAFTSTLAKGISAKLPIQDADTITAIGAAEYWSNDQLISNVQELYSGLQKGGNLLLTFYRSASPGAQLFFESVSWGMCFRDFDAVTKSKIDSNEGYVEYDRDLKLYKIISDTDDISLQKVFTPDSSRQEYRLFKSFKEDQDINVQFSKVCLGSIIEIYFDENYIYTKLSKPD